MPDQDKAKIRINTFAPMFASEAADLIISAQRAYNGIYIFDEIVGRIEKHFRSFRYIDRYGSSLDFLLERGIFLSHWQNILVAETSEKNLHVADENVQIGDRFIFTGARISSPGFWEFIAKLNPLEVIRLYLNDRHERRKDKEYREGLEEENLYLQNELIRNKLMRERLEMLREFRSDGDSRELIMSHLLGRPAERLIYQPLSQLGAMQDKGLISTAEIIPREDGKLSRKPSKT